MDKFKRILAAFTAFMITFSFSSFTAKAETSTDGEITLPDKVQTATILLQDVMTQQYKETVKEIEGLIKEKNYDRPITMESFMDQGNPFKDMDYIEFIATFSSINNYLSETGSQPVNIMDIDFISYSYTEDSFSENKPFKVEEYEQGQDGNYIKTGYHFTNEPETIGIYEETGDGKLKKVGEELKTPEQIITKYALIDLTVMDAKGLIAISGVDPEEISDDIQRRIDIIKNGNDNTSLRSAVFIEMPDRLLNRGEWNELFLKAVGYEPGRDVVIDNNTVVNVAATLVGQIPYEWGGKASVAGYDNTWWTYNEKNKLQKGLDCSGFVQWCYITAGYDKEITDQLYSTYAMLGSNLLRVDQSELKPGDVGVVEHRRTNHCGIYAGNGEWYHCSSYDGTVVKAPYKFTKFYRPALAPIAKTVKIYKEEKNIAPPVTMAQIIEKEEVIEEEIRSLDDDTVYEVEEQENENIQDPEGMCEPVEIDNSELTITEAADSGYTDEEIFLLAQLITHEAANQGLNGWIGVGEVVRNRIESPRFPSTLREVVFQPGQFTGASSITSITPRQDIVDTARMILNGLSILNNKEVLYFRNAHGDAGNWGNHRVYQQIGAHTFYLQ